VGRGCHPDEGTPPQVLVRIVGKMKCEDADGCLPSEHFDALSIWFKERYRSGATAFGDKAHMVISRSEN
jgi:hypothetical protein